MKWGVQVDGWNLGVDELARAEWRVVGGDSWELASLQTATVEGNNTMG